MLNRIWLQSCNLILTSHYQPFNVMLGIDAMHWWHLSSLFPNLGTHWWGICHNENGLFLLLHLPGWWMLSIDNWGILVWIVWVWITASWISWHIYQRWKELNFIITHMGWFSLLFFFLINFSQARRECH